MTNKQHLKILQQGVSAWNEWRRQIPTVGRPDLTKANLSGVNLVGADFFEVDLNAADLSSANFRKADFRGADLSGMHYVSSAWMRMHGEPLGSEQRFVELPAEVLMADDWKRISRESKRKVVVTNLQKANLSGANLAWANFSYADLRETNLTETYLEETNFSGANLAGADLSGCRMSSTKLIDIDLNTVEGLATVRHYGPSEMSVSTIYASRDNLPDSFLRGIGIPEDLVIHLRSMGGILRNFYSCFISYSSRDEEFANRLHADLQSRGVRCWFAPEDLKIGDPFRKHIDDAIRTHDKLLIILSSNSVSSSWVEKEVETAFEKERKQNRTVLFPIRLDDTVMETDQAWAADIRRTRHLGDFRDWRIQDSYKKGFDRLLRDLKAEGRAQPPSK
jgi:uncharacterized protein YjbI with pentapeptide repeats